MVPPRPPVGERAAPSRRRPAISILLSVFALAATMSLTGCVSQPTTQLEARPGDLVRAQIVAVPADGDVPVLPRDVDEAWLTDQCPELAADGRASCPAASRVYVLDPHRPADLPEGWEEAQPLPRPLVDRLTGVPEGATRTLEQLFLFGNRSEALVETHPRTATVSRFVEDADAYGRTWSTTTLDNGTLRVDPQPEDRNTSLELPSWCNARFCLFDSTLTGWNDTHLEVRHQPDRDSQVHVTELDTYLTVTSVTEDTFTVDNNDPRAGVPYQVHVHLEKIRAPPEGIQRAPNFELSTIDGGTIELAELHGRPVVIEFFATWCPSCIENTNHLRAVEDRFGDQVQIVAVNVDPWETSEQLRSFVRQNDVTWPVAVDQEGTVSQAYGVGSLSTEVLVDAEGVIVHVETGVADHDRVVGILENMLDTHEHDGHAHDHGDGAEGAT